jgi:hypothetical protein
MQFYFMLLAFLLTGAIGALGQDKQPSIEFDFVSKDYGPVLQGQTIKQIFTFANKGAGVLRIMDIGKS